MLTLGEKLGPYELLSLAGAGGMGEVYRARDTRLDRVVAIKVLPEHMSSNGKFRERFEREARAISSLKHPNICTLYDVGHQDGIDYLVLEYLEGESLADRLQRGPLPMAQVLAYGIQIADALERAHRQGVVHRDLKPGNVMVTKDGVKLLDFGLAKPMAGAALASSALGAMTASQHHKPLTAEGTIVGTFQYIAPEQLEGKDADPRSDIFAFGCVLYEMAAGRRPFDGKTQASVVASILASDPPPISSLQPLTPPAFERVVRTCLAKDPEERWQTAHDVKLQLKWIAEGGSQAGVAAPVAARRKHREWIAWSVAAVFLLLAGMEYWYARTAAPENLEFTVPAPEKATLNTMGWAGAPAVSPDGKTIAFLATTAEGVKSLWIRPLNSTESHPLAQTENATYPFWSPDSRFVGFFAEGKLKKMAVNGGAPIALCGATDGRGGSWSKPGFIIFGLRDGPLQKVSAASGTPVAITQLDGAKAESSHRFPLVLPDGDHYLFMVQDAHPHLSSGSLKSGRRLADFPDIDSSVGYSQGNLLFVRGTTLFAQAFDAARLQLTGDPVMIAEKVQFDPQFNFAVFSVSGKGELVYQGGATSLSTQLVSLDRSGKQVGGASGAGNYWNIRLSPLGTQLLVEVDEVTSGKAAIWLFDLITGTRTRLTFNDWSGYPVLSHNGRKLAFTVGQNGAELHVRDLASGMESTLFSVRGGSEVTGWSPDDRYVLFDVRNPGANWEIGVVDTTGQHTHYPLIQTSGYARWSRLSPDGKWLAYVGVETGYPEIYVVPIDFNGPQPKVGVNKAQISTAGGLLPVWSRSQKELFFTNVSMTMLFAVPFATDGGMVHAGSASKLFDLSPHSYAFFYDVSPDGKKFYVAEAPPGSSPPLTVVTNWQARIK